MFLNFDQINKGVWEQKKTPPAPWPGGRAKSGHQRGWPGGRAKSGHKAYRRARFQLERAGAGTAGAESERSERAPTTSIGTSRLPPPPRPSLSNRHGASDETEAKRETRTPTSTCHSTERASKLPAGPAQRSDEFNIDREVQISLYLRYKRGPWELER